ncbi:ECF RNA polymerase sigma factor SigW [bioreactor metagenome]|uniref:ECF RNA polymerase sigma factor SigW n=1 Tax=bioreactor metagenome TaxID=1076179 RepID=A0A644YBH1_9ZZZZ|nr:RNA polymerase sigma factor [Christensenella sp.]
MEHNMQQAARPDIRTADGFAAAVKQTERLLFAASYAILGNGDACADVVQGALMKAWEHRGSLKNGAQFKSWLVQIVQNESKNFLRRKPNLPLDENIPSAEEDQNHIDVKQAVNALPESARLIVMLYYFERYSVKDICGLLDLPEGTVHSRLARAREQLRKELPDYANVR